MDPPKPKDHPSLFEDFNVISLDQNKPNFHNMYKLAVQTISLENLECTCMLNYSLSYSAVQIWAYYILKLTSLSINEQLNKYIF